MAELLSVSNSSKVKAETLKAEGNAFHIKGENEKAYSKYSEAIKLDPNNAVLYANRAASALAMKEYLDAASDAEEAVKIDPTSIKAWGRLGKAAFALGAFKRSSSSYEKALAMLPSELSPSEKVLKKQFEDGIESAQESLKRFSTEKDDSFFRMPSDQADKHQFPWQRALQMEAQLIAAQRPFSSAWVIMNAHRDFVRGVETMKLTRDRSEGDMIGWEGKPTAMDDLSNGILRDPRAFFMAEPDKWVKMYDRQVTFENHVRKGWSHGGAKTVKKEAIERLRSSGWDNLRPALSMTIRGWFMRGFISSSLKQYATALEFYRRTLDILQWGRRTWKDVPRDDRGTVFDLTFVRGVKRFYMNALLEGYATYGKSNSEFKIEDAAEVAHEIIADARGNPPSPSGSTPYDPGFLLSFWTYPIAEALAVIGYYHMQIGLHSSDNPKEARKQFRDAAKHYCESAEAFPQDEEKHPYFLSIALEAYWRRNSPLRVTLPLCKRVRSGLEKSASIWGPGHNRSGNISITQCLQFEEEYIGRVESGEVTMDQKATPVGI